MPDPDREKYPRYLNDDEQESDNNHGEEDSDA